MTEHPWWGFPGMKQISMLLAHIYVFHGKPFVNCFINYFYVDPVEP